MATRRRDRPLPFVPRITPFHTVPIKSQIAAGLECAIRDRFLIPGAALPPTRVVADRLGVHRNTVAAAYRRLRDRGLATGEPGAPMRVRSAAVPRPVSTPRSGLAAQSGNDSGVAARLVREMMTRARSEGVSRCELVRHVAPWLTNGTAPRLCLVEPRPGLRAVIHAELRQRLSVSVLTDGWRAIQGGALIVARPEIVPRLEIRFPGVHRVQPLVLGGGSSALELAHAIRRPGVVALVTRSSLIRRFALELTAGYHGAGLSVALPDPGEPFALNRAARIARLILVDASCRGIRLETRARVRPLHILSAPTIRALSWHLGSRERG